MDDRAQISLEAILIIGVAILVVISVFNLAFSRLGLARDVGEAGEAKMIGVLLAESINNAYANGANFSITLTEEEINYTQLKELQLIEGGGMALPIVIDRARKRINITKDMSKTGGGDWTAEVSIIPFNISRTDPTVQYPETTIRNTGTYIIIYADASNIGVVP
jgi:hypothetical protein